MERTEYKEGDDGIIALTKSGHTITIRGTDQILYVSTVGTDGNKYGEAVQYIANADSTDWIIKKTAKLATLLSKEKV